jgi:acyl carrier protein
MDSAMNDTRARLAKCFAAVFPDLTDREMRAASPASVGSWDSLASVTLLSVLEEEFNVEIAPEDAAQLVSFELVLDYLQNEKRIS